nr:transporter substrate-binding domain-containing protein [uncultured Desulfobacter sp.]
MLFTDEYIFAPLVIFTRSDASFVGSMEDLRGKTVSVEEGFALHETLKREYPWINLKVDA